MFHIAERPGAALRPGKNWPVYGYRAVNAVGVGKAQARNAACRPRLVSLLGPDRRSRNTLARPTRLSSLDQRCDLVVLRIDDDHLVVLDEEGMGLELRHLG